MVSGENWTFFLSDGSFCKSLKKYLTEIILASEAKSTTGSGGEGWKNFCNPLPSSIGGSAEAVEETPKLHLAHSPALILQGGVFEGGGGRQETPPPPGEKNFRLATLRLWRGDTCQVRFIVMESWIQCGYVAH